MPLHFFLLGDKLYNLIYLDGYIKSSLSFEREQNENTLKLNYEKNCFMLWK